MKNIALLFIFLFLLSSGIYGQTYNIKGMVKDDSSAAVSYATITLHSPDSVMVKGTVTDTAGVYVLSGVPNGKYIFTASCIGFATHTENIEVNGTDLDMGSLTLAASNNMLGEVEVKGHSFIRKEGHALIIPDRQQIQHAYSAYDLLSNLMIPGVEVDRRSGQVKNFTGSVTICINGVGADMREVMALRPKDIEKVEYHDAPTGVYSGQNAVINFITRQYRAGGYVSIDGRQSIGYLDGDYNAAAKVVKGGTSYKFFGGHTMSKVKSSIHRYEGMNFPGNFISRETVIDEAIEKNNSQYARFDIQNTTARRTLTGKVSLIRNNVPLSTSAENVTYRTTQGTTESKAYGENTQTGWMPNVVLMGNFKIKNNQAIVAFIDASYSRNDYIRTYNESNFNSLTNAEENFYKGIASLVYNIGLKKNNMFAVQFSHMYQNSNMSYTGNYNKDQQLWSAETFLYLHYNQQLNKKMTLYTQAGFSSLQYRLNSMKRVDRIGPRLTMKLMAQPANNQFLQVAVDLASTYPTIDKLNDMSQDISPLMVLRGNPDLKNSLFCQANVGYSVQLGPVNLMAAGYYYFMNSPQITDYYIEDGKIINTYSSNDGVHFANAMAEATWKIIPSLSLKAKGQWVYTRLNGPEGRQLHSWIGNFSADYYLKNWKFNIYASLPCKITDTSLFRKETEYDASYGASISWNSRGWSVEAGTSNPFTRQYSAIETLVDRDYTYRQSIHNNSMQQTAYIKVAYTFDFGKQTSKEQNDTGRKVNSAILKAY